MATKTALLPTTSADVETWLRAEAARCSHFQGIADDDVTGRYAYLFGLACSRLAEARREYLRLMERQAERTTRPMTAHEMAAARRNVAKVLKARKGGRS